MFLLGRPLCGGRWVVWARAPRPGPLPLALSSGPLVVALSRSWIAFSRPLPPERARSVSHRHLTPIAFFVAGGFGLVADCGGRARFLAPSPARPLLSLRAVGMATRVGRNARYARDSPDALRADQAATNPAPTLAPTSPAFAGSSGRGAQTPRARYARPGEIGRSAGF